MQTRDGRAAGEANDAPRKGGDRLDGAAQLRLNRRRPCVGDAINSILLGFGQTHAGRYLSSIKSVLKTAHVFPMGGNE
jgi:hypothetical protein